MAEEKLEQIFDQIQPFWRDCGITGESILIFAEKYRIHTTVLYNDEILTSYKPPNRKHCRCMSFSIEGNHALFFKNPRVLLQKKPPKRKLRQDPKPIVAKFVPYEGLQDGTFYFENLDWLRQEFLNQGLCPRVTVSSPHCLKSLTIEKCKILKEPEHGPEIREWLENLGLPWYGDSLPACSLRVLLHLRKPQRKKLSDEEKQNILTEQEHKCMDCSCELKKPEFHHVIPLASSVAKQDFVALCSTCHQNYTFAQDGPRSENILESQFEKSVWDQYVLSKKPKAWVYEVHQHQGGRGDPILIDIVRCRRNALYECAHEIPIFSPLDRFEKAVPGKLYDISYVSKPVKWSNEKLLENMPYQGPSYYMRVAVQYMLHKGIISWDHILFGINASAHLPPNTLRGPLETMENAWPDTDIGRDLKKKSINSMLGLMCIEEPSVWMTKSFYQDETKYMDGWRCKSETDFAHGTVLDVYYQTTLDSGFRSMRPLHDIALHTEATRLAMAVHALKALGVPKQDITTLKTDSVQAYCRQKRKAACLEIANTTLAMLKRPKLLSQSEVSSTESDAKVYRLEEKEQPLKTTPKMPIVENPPPEIEEWAWEDHEPEAALQLAMAGKSFALMGHAGSGKTYLTKQIVEKLKEKGERVVCLAKTHVACSLLEGQTINRFVYKNIKSGSYSGWVVVDEFSLAELKLYCFLYRLLEHCKFIFVGSWHQMAPVAGHTFLDTQLPDSCVEHSRMFHRLCGGNRIVLKECKRADATLYNWYVSLCPGGSRYETPFEDVLKEAREFFNGTETPKTTLCIDHEKRKAINRRANLREKPDDAVFVKVPKLKCPNAPQDFYLYEGQQLQAVVQHSKGGLKNGLIYTVSKISEDSVEFLQGGLVLALKFVAKHMRLCHAMTISSSQGRTLHGVVEIISGHPMLCRKKLMVCLSRATEAPLVQVR